MKVVILAGGFGTRISEESVIKPKPMIEIGYKPILWHIMKIYSHYGFNEFIICLGYKGYILITIFSTNRMLLTIFQVIISKLFMDIPQNHGK
jgi:glucose-1-phosphate cytidylyltransferase